MTRLNLTEEEHAELLEALDCRVPLANLETHRSIQSLVDRLNAGSVLELGEKDIETLDGAIPVALAGITLARGRVLLGIHGRLKASEVAQ